jgi:dolichol-phosphate mannosyltransferase subunit 3
MTLQLPFWFLVTFGAWLLFRLGWGMVTFRDTPDAYAELMDEIKLAKADLRTKGVDVD